MFIGHYAPAFAAATMRGAPRLGTLFIGAQLVDIAFFSFLPLGVEHMRLVPGITATNPMDLYDMPWTHSLVGACVWGAAFALLLRVTMGTWRAGLIGGAVVVSHWLLDLLVHRPDLTIAGSPPKLGLGLWDAPMIEMPLELILLLSTAAFYALRTRAVRQAYALPVLIAVLLALQAINWFGAPPTRVDAQLWGMGLFAYGLAAAVAWWVARTRVPR
jgi:hypothetical protein